MSDLTVIYYTSNQEKPHFEQQLQLALLSTIKDLPLISISQKPINFGRNICVGEVGVSSQNAYRQLQIGAMEAKTKFICTAEADHLYPPEYFQFRPPDDSIFYLVAPLYVLFVQRGKGKVFVRKPNGSESAMIVERKLLIERIETILKPIGRWGLHSANGDGWPYLLDRGAIKRSRFEIANPTVSFKTDQQMHRRTPHDVKSKTREIPYWGKVQDVIRKYMT